MRAGRLISFAITFATVVSLLPPASVQSQQIKGPPAPKSGVLGNPNRLFDQLAQGNETLPIANAGGLRGLLWKYAKDQAITGEITREQFATFCQQLTTSVVMGGTASEPRLANAWDTLAGVEFRRKDANGDGLLNPDEMEGRLRDALSSWDRNSDSLVNMEEFKPFYSWKMADRLATNGRKWVQPTLPAWGNMELRKNDDWDKLPPVYGAGKLPDGLPNWFLQFDFNIDGQIGLYEWRQADKPVEEFIMLDRNGDGLLTVEEVLYRIGQMDQTGNGQGGGTQTKKKGGVFAPDFG